MILIPTLEVLLASQMHNRLMSWAYWPGAQTKQPSSFEHLITVEGARLHSQTS
jgi:hypothetical protein